MEDRVAVGVAGWPDVAGDRDASQHAGPIGFEAVEIDAEADAGEIVHRGQG
jgi:hypothetical protein